ncbi:MAG: trimethylamine methyltransferase family protein [Thermofilaceae archaeon]|nr:trimethylamine methyltransferase family protein [Thermofilaceae archaeon]MCX8180880.1 trimethylamine methyltransferase family protein [Thermofilaceae archaeon]MDW8003445.1 trimethylamine methyltransferase family protein [Thermofilaceae archaeon]
MPRPALGVLLRNEAEEVHSKALELLEKVGILFEDKLVEKLVKEAGCEVKDGRVLIREELVGEALSKAPKRFDLYDREGERVATLGDGALVFNPGSAAVRILDYGAKEPRPPTLEDLRKFVVLADALDHLKALSTALVPSDVPVEVSDAERLYVVLKYSRKPVVTGGFTVENVPVMVDMLEAVRNDYREKPFAIFDVCPSPPLSWSSITSRNLVDLARLGVPAEIISMPGLGGNATVTVYGALLQHHAEVLSGVVVAQLASPGAKVIYGGSPTLTHPRYGTALIAAPEAVLVSLAYRDMARLINLPCHTYMAISDAKTLDPQAGAEEGFTAALAALAAFDVVSGPGMLEFESTQSMEKLVIDNEVCGLALRLARGFSLNPSDFDVIREVVEKGKGNFMAHRHTLLNLRKEVHVPKVWDAEPTARRNLLEWAKEEVKRILREYEPLVLSGERLENLEKVRARLWRKTGREPPSI